MTTNRPLGVRPDRGLARVVHGAAHLAQRRPKTIVALWLVFVIGCLAAGAVTGTRALSDTDAGVGQSKAADQLIDQRGLHDPATESVLVTSGSAGETNAVAADLARRLGGVAEVASVTGPAQSSSLAVGGGRIALVQVALRGDPDDAADHVQPVMDAVAAVGRAHPDATLQEAGGGTIDKTINDVIARDLDHAELISLPITLVILVLAFGALVAASVPLVLGLTSVAAATGVVALLSHLVPNSDSTSAVVVLVGLAVGVDYSLFYVRREREERRRGHGPARLAKRPQQDSALVAAAASVGRAILVSGLTVTVALAGLLITGAPDFISMGLGTIAVVLIAMIGSLTVLPAVLALLGDRVDRGRVPFYRRMIARRTRREAAAGRRLGVWAGLSRAVAERPVAALVSSVCILGALAMPLLQMHTANLGASDLPQDLPVVQATAAIEKAFPGAPQDASLVVTGHGLDSDEARAQLAALGQRALQVTGGRGDVGVRISADGTAARVDVPMPDHGLAAANQTVRDLRDDVAPTAAQVPGADGSALLTGDAASSYDYSERMKTATPEVIGFVLALGFLLLLLTFRAPLLAASMMLLSLISIGAAYGMLVAVFQNTWAEHVFGFHTTGHIIDWLPLFMFVILFGLSMDYTVLVLERIREERLAGRTPREAAANGVAATAGTVTSAAVVMVAVFAIFATLGIINFQQLGFGLAAAVLLDATIVRGVALPAVVALLGERGWPVRRRQPRPEWDDAPVAASLTDSPASASW